MPKLASQKKAALKTVNFRNNSKFFLKFAGAGCILIFLAVASLLFLGGKEILINTDVGVVLGNEVYYNGKPSPRLAARLDKSLELYKRGILRTIIVSGGVGLSAVDEAKAMALYLESKGVPKKNIVIDSKGINTRQTAKFTASWLKENKRDGVIVISQHFHIPRTVLAHKAAGCGKVGQASPDYWERDDIYSTLREIPANLVYWWKYSS